MSLQVPLGAARPGGASHLATAAAHAPVLYPPPPPRVAAEMTTLRQQVGQGAPLQTWEVLQPPAGGWPRSSTAVPAEPQVIRRAPLHPSEAGLSRSLPSRSAGELQVDIFGLTANQVEGSSPSALREPDPWRESGATLSTAAGGSTQTQAQAPTPGVPPLEKAADAPLTQRDLQAWLEAERALWFSSMQELHTQQMQALEAITDKVDEKIGLAMATIGEVSRSCEARLADAEKRLKLSVQDLETRLEADSTERQAALVEVRSDLNSQWAQVHSLSVSRERASASTAAGAANAEADAAALQERRELLVAFAAICSDVEALQDEQGKLAPEVEMLLKWQEGMAEESRTQSGNLIKVRAMQSQLSSDVQAVQEALRRGEDELAREPTRQGGQDELLQKGLQQAQEDLEVIRKQQGRTETVQAQVMSDLGAVKSQLLESIKALWAANRNQSTELEAVRSRGPSTAGSMPSSPERAAGPNAAAKGDVEDLRKEVDAVRSSHSILKAVQGQHGRSIEALRKGGVAAARQGGEDESSGGGGSVAAVADQMRSLELVINDAHNDIEAVKDEQRRQGAEIRGVGDEIGRVAGNFEGLRQDLGRVNQCAEALQIQHSSQMELLQSQSDVFTRELAELRNLKGGFNWPWQCSNTEGQTPQ